MERNNMGDGTITSIEMKIPSIWITKENQIENASLESLEGALLTEDGAGKEIKKKVLEEVKKRLTEQVPVL